jgi:hypothetical protein
VNVQQWSAALLVGWMILGLIAHAAYLRGRLVGSAEAGAMAMAPQSVHCPSCGEWREAEILDTGIGLYAVRCAWCDEILVIYRLDLEETRL